MALGLRPSSSLLAHHRNNGAKQKKRAKMLVSWTHCLTVIAENEKNSPCWVNIDKQCLDCQKNKSRSVLFSGDPPLMAFERDRTTQCMCVSCGSAYLAFFRRFVLFLQAVYEDFADRGGITDFKIFQELANPSKIAIFAK